MTIDEKRSVLAQVYPGDWSEKVWAMPDDQIIALYTSFGARGILDGVPEYKSPRGIDRLVELDKSEFDFDKAEQLSMFDILEKGD